VNEFRENALRASLSGFANAREDGDWSDVLRRTRTASRRRIVGAVGVAAVVIAGTASAFALVHPSIDFLSAQKGPDNVVTDFGKIAVSAPPGWPVGTVEPDQTRQITTVTLDGVAHVLYLAPATAGGFCEEWSNTGGTDCTGARRTSGDNQIGVATSGRSLIGTFVSGWFFQQAGARIEISFADGATDEIPFVWVTDPINAGFFIYRVSDAHDGRPTSLALYGDNGDVIARQGIPAPHVPDFASPSLGAVPGHSPLTVPSDAVYNEREQLFDLRADDGTRVGLWIAPEKGGGMCFWSNGSSGCDHGRPVGARPSAQEIGPLLKARPEFATAIPILGLGFSGGSSVFVCCTVEADVARVELRFEDGDRIDVTPKRSYLIAVIPSRHYALGHRIDEIVAYDSSGAEIGHHTIGSQPGLYPCAKADEVYLGYGRSRCP
jgi:hypothetical protein